MLFYEIFLNICSITIEASIFALVVMALRLILQIKDNTVYSLYISIYLLFMMTPYLGVSAGMGSPRQRLMFR